jgi:hypothetical protein
MRYALALLLLGMMAGVLRADDRSAAPVDPVTGLTPCDAACLQMFRCLPTQSQPTYAHCVVTCDAGKREALATLAAASCGEIDAALGRGDAPIRRRDCAQLLANRKVRRPAAGRRELLSSRLWCVSGNGRLRSGPNGFAADGMLTSAGSGACWMLDGDRLAWTYDGKTWKTDTVRWPRLDGEPLRVGAQRLAACPVIQQKDPEPVLP